MRLDDYEERVVVLLRQAVTEAVASERRRCEAIVRELPLPYFETAFPRTDLEALRSALANAISGAEPANKFDALFEEVTK